MQHVVGFFWQDFQIVRRIVAGIKILVVYHVATRNLSIMVESGDKPMFSLVLPLAVVDSHIILRTGIGLHKNILDRCLVAGHNMQTIARL